MPTNAFPDFLDTPASPATDAFVITPHVTDELSAITKAIYVGTAGDVTLRPMQAVVDVQFKNVPAGTILDIRVRAVRVAGTTAGNLVGLA